MWTYFYICTAMFIVSGQGSMHSGLRLITGTFLGFHPNQMGFHPNQDFAEIAQWPKISNNDDSERNRKTGADSSTKLLSSVLPSLRRKNFPIPPPAPSSPQTLVPSTMSCPSLCDVCRHPSQTQLCVACYSVEPRHILSRCQQNLQQISAQKAQLQPARNELTRKYLVRNRLIVKEIRMAIQEADMERWEILLDRRDKVLKMWEEEKRVLEGKDRELDKSVKICVETAEKEIRELREMLGSSAGIEVRPLREMLDLEQRKLLS